MNMYMYLYVWMYFWIDYKFIFFYEVSLLFREVGGGTQSLGGPSIGGGELCEGGDMHSPRGQSMDGCVGSQPISGHSSS